MLSQRLFGLFSRGFAWELCDGASTAKLGRAGRSTVRLNSLTQGVAKTRFQPLITWRIGKSGRRICYRTDWKEKLIILLRMVLKK